MTRLGAVDPADRARADLEWLRHVGAVRSVEEDDGGAFVVELATRALIAIPPEAVCVLRAGVLAGWRLPRERQA